MFIINEDTLEYPIAEGAVRTLFPSTLFPTPFIPPEPYYWVHDTLLPEWDRQREYLKELDPVKTDGVWWRQYEILPLNAETIQENEEAAQRQLVASIVDQTQGRLDAFAKTRNYDGILSLCTYSTSTNSKFQVEGQYGIEMRDATWAKLYDILAKVEAGTRPTLSSYAEIEHELPATQWPF